MKRRDFFNCSVIVGASIPLGITPLLSSCSNTENKSKITYTPEDLGMFSFAKKAPDGKPLKAALVGCGSRGTGAAIQFLSAGNDLSIIALADLLEDRQKECREILIKEKNNKVADDMCFLGFDAYKKVMELDIDVVLIATPTHFHPTHLKAAVEANKHVFMEKPAGEGLRNRFFGADTTTINSYVVYALNSGSKTQEPSFVRANPFGVKNMSGNVFEYCSDWYSPDAYSMTKTDVSNPEGPDSGTEHVIRGGNYASSAGEVRSAYRAFTDNEAWLKTDCQQPKSIWWYSDMRGIGFRVVCVPDGIL